MALRSGSFQWKHDCTAALRERIGSVARDVIRNGAPSQRVPFKFGMNSWANVSRRGNYNDAHSHQGATWSGVYYVSSGEPDNDDPANGALELFDPRVGVKIDGFATRRCLITPKPGLVIFFPSWLIHVVHPFSGTGERISIAFNVTAVFDAVVN